MKGNIMPVGVTKAVRNMEQVSTVLASQTVVPTLPCTKTKLPTSTTDRSQHNASTSYSTSPSNASLAATSAAASESSVADAKLLTAVRSTELEELKKRLPNAEATDPEILFCSLVMELPFSPDSGSRVLSFQDSKRIGSLDKFHYI